MIRVDKTWYIILLPVVLHSIHLSAMETEKRNSMVPHGKIYYEFYTLESELATLRDAMELIYKQEDLGEHYYTIIKDEQNPKEITYYFHLNATKDQGSLIRNLIESRITLHEPYYKESALFNDLKEALHKIYSLSDEIVENRIRFLKSHNKDAHHVAYRELSKSFSRTYNKITQLILTNQQQWSNDSTLSTLKSLVNNFKSESLPQLVLNKFAHEVIYAVEDQKIIQYKKELTKFFLNDSQEERSMSEAAQEALVVRFATLYNTSNGKLQNPQKKETLLEAHLFKKAFKKKYDPDIRILILEHASKESFIQQQDQIKDALKQIRQTVPQTERDIDQLINSEGNPNKFITNLYSRISALYKKLEKACQEK